MFGLDQCGWGKAPTKPENWPVWKTIQLGTHRSVEDLGRAIQKSGFRISLSAGGILKKVIVAPELTEVELVTISLYGNLGYLVSTLQRIYDSARRLGLGLCPAEVGPQLRLQYADQPDEDALMIAMDPLMDRTGFQRIFRVAHDYRYMFGPGDKLFRVLDVDSGDPESEWNAYNSAKWVFVRQ